MSKKMIQNFNESFLTLLRKIRLVPLSHLEKIESAAQKIDSELRNQLELNRKLMVAIEESKAKSAIARKRKKLELYVPKRNKI